MKALCNLEKRGRKEQRKMNKIPEKCGTPFIAPMYAD
jgi:hypothetical protein